jgi:hypothetical protein
MKKSEGFLKQPIPVTACTICGAFGYAIELVNTKCGRFLNARRCGGTNKSSLSENDYLECPACAAEGYRGGSGVFGVPDTVGFISVGERIGAEIVAAARRTSAKRFWVGSFFSPLR